MRDEPAALGRQIHAGAGGLVQLHQLRGSAGTRWDMRLRDLLSQSNSAQSEKRLACSERAQRTGRAGFAISERDLDLRGAGDLFSKRQSGHVQVFAESAITRLEFDLDHLGKSPARYSLTARFASSVKQGNWERFDGPPEFQRLPVADLDASAAIIRSTVTP
jgi:hypothetical protein